MAEQGSQEKTEKASAEKLRKSREDGQVTRSRDLATCLSLVASLAALWLCAGWFLEGLEQAFRLSWPNLQHSELSLDDLRLLLTHNLIGFIKLLAPLLLAPLLVLLGSLIPGGWVLASKNFHFKASKLNPITGLARIVSAQNASEFLKSLLKASVLMGVAGMLIPATFAELMALQQTHVAKAVALGLTRVVQVIALLLAVFVLFAVIDIPLQRFFFLKKLRMSKQELKDEHKNREGRPETKSRIRQVQRQMAQRQINRVMPLADAVIVNPQHYAVALKYDPSKAKAPYVLAKGVDDTALYIRRMATAHGLEVIQAPPLARALYHSTQINQQIPAPLYAAVAHVLTYLVQLRAFRNGLRPRPAPPDHLPVPDSLANQSPP
ncbi:flagellar type III secretion system protein FlhB [Pseudomonas sp. HR96]|uniref:flagellar type III secretion system protein FlhB n=1 Tax=Pseudomonas sp. HR96 TaxID=1027966 RepID=UPI002A760CEF|nr:flagellar type III secretion system protein FlhB [Pseudomonas sp. HR96]WPP00042.1 flagellar type III secretion system protein FlhB [Pseudomonas sp. HR96]